MRVLPELYESRDWRCWLTASGSSSGSRPFRPAVYVAAEDWWMPFPHDPAVPMTAEQIATALEPTLDGRARRSDPDHESWFADLLNECSPEALPVFCGTDLPRDASRVLLTSDGEGRAVELRPEPLEPRRGI